VAERSRAHDARSKRRKKSKKNRGSGGKENSFPTRERWNRVPVGRGPAPLGPDSKGEGLPNVTKSLARSGNIEDPCRLIEQIQLALKKKCRRVDPLQSFRRQLRGVRCFLDQDNGS